MPSYPTYKLSEVADILDSFRKPINSTERTKRIQGKTENELYPYYGATGQVGLIDEYLTDGEYVLVGEDGAPFLEPFKNKSYIIRGKAWVNNHAHILSGKKDVLSNQYLNYFLNSFDYRNYVNGTTRLKLTQGNLTQIPIPLPPLATQHAIVTRIETLFAELDKAVLHLRTAQQQLKTYRQAVLNHWLNNDDGKWEMVKLGEVAEKIFDGPFGTHLKSDDYVSSGIRVVRLENIKAGYFDDSKQSYVTPEKYEIIKRHTVYPTDLIMSTFISEKVKVCQMPKHIEFAVNKADCIGIRLKPLANNDFIKYYLSLRSVYHQLEIQVHGATRPRVNTTQIKNIEINLPPLTEQQRIVNEIELRLSQATASETYIENALQQAEALRQSILKKAFSGELV